MSLFTVLPFSTNDDSLPKVSTDNILFLDEPETSAYGHWMLSGSNASLTDIINSRALTPQDNSFLPSYSSNYLTLSAKAGRALQSPRFEVADSDAYTLAMVMRLDSDNTSPIVMWGTLGVTADAYGGSSYLRKELETYEIIENYRGAISNTDSGLVIQRNQWAFIAVSVAYDGADSLIAHTLVNENGANTTGPVTGTYSPNVTDPISLGNVAYDTSSTDVPFDVAEFIMFDNALTPADLVSLYNRSKERMSRRSITI